uniref:Uncharacterized protein n=1 Tax=Rhipicephalus pulchellus TaxID=72859 RepID=L7LX74_RHIPC
MPVTLTPDNASAALKIAAFVTLIAVGWVELKPRTTRIIGHTRGATLLDLVHFVLSFVTVVLYVAKSSILWPQSVLYPLDQVAVLNVAACDCITAITVAIVFLASLQRFFCAQYSSSYMFLVLAMVFTAAATDFCKFETSLVTVASFSEGDFRTSLVVLNTLLLCVTAGNLVVTGLRDTIVYNQRSGKFFAGVAAPLVAASSMDLGASPTADRHVQPTACVRTDCPVLHPEDSHGSFVSMPAILQSSFIGDITYDSGLFNTPTGVTSTDKDIKAPPKLHRFSGEGRSSTSTMLNRCLFLVQFFAGVAAPLVAASSMDLGASPTADRHVQPTACVRTDCPVLHPEDSHGSFVSMPAILQTSFIGDITYDSGLFNTPTGVTSTDKDIKAPPKLQRFSGEGRSSTSTMLNRCLFLVQVCYLNNAYCFRSDDRCLLLVPCPHSCSFVFTSLYADIVHCLCSLLLSGDVELNPGPTHRSTRANTTNSSLLSRTASPDSNRMEGSHTPSADPDNQCSVLLVPCPHSCSFVFTSLYADIVHCLCSLLLSGDVELNPGPTQRSTRANTTNSSLSSRTAFPDSNRMEGSHTPSADPDNQCSVSEMFAQILSGQKKIEQDVAELRNSVNSRFEAIESRLAVLEQTPPLHNATLFDNLCCQIENLTSTVNKLSSRNDDLENRSRRNNIIIHGLEESEDENDDSLQASLKKFFSDTLKVDFPQIERFHRIGTYHGSKSRPVILRLLDFREKMKVLRNGFKLKGSKLRLTEDFSEHVRFIRKKLWDATASFRNNGSTVHLRYDHVYVDSERYDWDCISNSLLKSSKQSIKHSTVSSNRAK